jgi:hypothetical protein
MPYTRETMRQIDQQSFSCMQTQGTWYKTFYFFYFFHCLLRSPVNLRAIVCQLLVFFTRNSVATSSCSPIEGKYGPQFAVVPSVNKCYFKLRTQRGSVGLTQIYLCMRQLTFFSRPNEKGIRLDAQTALDYILSHPKLEKTKIILYGQSLGGAVAIFLAGQNENRVRLASFLTFLGASVQLNSRTVARSTALS